MRVVMWDPQRNWSEAWEVVLKDRRTIAPQQRLLVDLILADHLCEVNAVRSRTPVDEQ